MNCELSDQDLEYIIEAMAESAHDAWMKTCRSLGIESRRSPWGEEFMVPFAELSDTAREFDRQIVRAILATLRGKVVTLAPDKELSDQDLEYIAAGKSLTVQPRPRQPVYGSRGSTRGTASASPTPATPASSSSGGCAGGACPS